MLSIKISYFDDNTLVTELYKINLTHISIEFVFIINCCNSHIFFILIVTASVVSWLACSPRVP